MTTRVQDLIDKRKRSWAKRHDIEYDKKITDQYALLMKQDTAEGKNLRREMWHRPWLLVETFFQVVDKSGKDKPFFLNNVQREFIGELEGRKDSRPFFILKSRQQGFTTLITAIQLSYALVRKNFRGYTLANTARNASSIFNDKCKVMYGKLPDLLKQHEKYNSKHELYFDERNSGWQVSVATDDVGRSATLHFVHYSEVAFFECSLAKLKNAIGQAVSRDSNPIEIYESTANGMNEAKELWDSGTCHNLFYEWWKTDEYESDNTAVIDTEDTFLSQRVKTLRDMGISEKKIAWYCEKFLSYGINRVNSIKAEYPCSPEEAFISSGTGVFDNESISDRLLKIDHLQAGKRGYFEYKKVTKVETLEDENVITSVELRDIHFIESNEGYIVIHKEPEVKVEKGITYLKPYTIGGDTAGNGIDYFTAKVIDNITRESVATLHKQNFDEDLYAEQMYCLGKFYNEAQIVIEINFSEYPMRVLKRTYNYPNLYMREKISALGDKRELALGFQTTLKTKPIIIQNLVTLIREDVSIENDVETLKEMLTFVRQENGSYSAIEGKHDDLVMALAIGQFACNKGNHEWIRQEKNDNPFRDFIKKNFKQDTHFDNEDSEYNDFIDWGD